ncbi:response regulator transcription factor [Prosthecomicrobium sp. N25]|uniref:response regulator transcription factor n=1 Tax=Prosthecomicrobium sp. N25 TaxID=3129254 RepID=UPI003078A5B3
MKQPPTILVVDDEPQIRRFLRYSLEASGYAVSLADCGAAALRLVAAGAPDLMILDLGLPDLDGKVVLGQVRQTSDMPVIVLSARADEDEKITALDLGADDYVAKPFGIRELLARIRANLKPQRSTAGSQERLTLGDLVIDIAAHRVDRGGEPIRLTPKEFSLLVLLAANAGRVLTHRQILMQVWGAAHVEDVAYLRVFIGQLRQKIRDNSGGPRLIVTEPGVGYRAIADR